MPMYQTKTIAGILEPVAQQVSKLIILHEEGEDGNAMPDLERPVSAVSSAVNNLVHVGQDTIASSQDANLKREMPKSLEAIEKAADLLEQACKDMKRDPYSKPGRDRLIAGSRGILQGTTAMLVIFDESQVRKLCRDCKKVLDYLAISEVIETMEDLVQFVKDLSPCLSKVCHDVEVRRKDLLNPYQRESLGHHLEQLKTLAPILICSMKIFIQILSQQGGKGMEEAVENRNYLAKRMTDEIDEITRILEEPMREDISAMTNIPHGSNLAELSFQDVSNKLLQMIRKKQAFDQRSVMQLLELGFKIADQFEGQTRAEILEACNNLDGYLRTTGSGQQTPEVRQRIGDLLDQLRARIESATINRIILEMADIATPLKQFSDAVNSGENRHDLISQRGQNLRHFTMKMSKTATIVSYACARSKQRADSLHHLSSRIQNLTPQLINAGTIKINYPENKAVEENFYNLRKQFADSVQNIRDMCDDSIDLATFLSHTEDHIRHAVDACEDGIGQRNSQKVVDNTALAARLANRLLSVLYREVDNSEDPKLKKDVDAAGERLKNAITPFVENGRSLTTSMGDAHVASQWRAAAKRLLATVAEITRLFSDLNLLNTTPTSAPLQQQHHQQHHHQPQQQQQPHYIANNFDMLPPPIPPPPVFIEAPPRPPLPAEATYTSPPRPPHPDTDDEEGLFTSEPRSNRPIHVAAHGLYQEVKQWDHSDNELIAAAKKIAYLMAHLSELIRGGKGTKRELIACAKALADASERITELAKELARHCTDKKIRTNLLQVCEKIPTLGTQLRVLSTVKATMMGQNMDSEEDQEAMDMLVFNAQKLNQAVKETVRAAESASIRVRSDAGFKLKWVRKQPWFQ